MEISQISEDYFSNKLFELRKLSKHISTEVSRSNLFHYVAEQVTKLMEANGSAIYTYDSTLDELTLSALYNLRENLLGIKIKIKDGLMSQVVRGLEPLKIDDYRVWPGSKIMTFEEDQYRAILQAPILWRDRLFGVLGVVRTGDCRPFSKFDLNILGILAIQVAIVLSNPELNE